MPNPAPDLVAAGSFLVGQTLTARPAGPTAWGICEIVLTAEQSQGAIHTFFHDWRFEAVMRAGVPEPDPHPPLVLALAPAPAVLPSPAPVRQQLRDFFTALARCADAAEAEFRGRVTAILTPPPEPRVAAGTEASPSD